jgi:hypothetical protein
LVEATEKFSFVYGFWEMDKRVKKICFFFSASSRFVEVCRFLVCRRGFSGQGCPNAGKFDMDIGMEICCDRQPSPAPHSDLLFLCFPEC